MKLIPSEGSQDIVHRALAEGNVIITTRDDERKYVAMGDEAYYLEAEKSLFLRGQDGKKAQLIITEESRGSPQTKSHPQIFLRQLGESTIRTGWTELRDMPGMEELRREAGGLEGSPKDG